MVDGNFLIDDFPDGLLTVGMSLEIELANAAMAKIVGCAPADLIGRPFDVVLPRSATSGTSGADAQRRLFDDIMALASSPPDPQRLPLKRIAPIRHRRGADIEVAFTVSRLRRPLGGALVCVRSLEESIQFAEEDSHDRARADRVHQSIFENAPIGIFHYDTRGIVTACNELFISIIGSSRPQIIGLDLHTLRDRDMIRCVDDSLGGRRASYQGDYRSVTGEKTTPMNGDFAPVFGGERQVVGGVGLIQDVTERREAERLVARAERMASLGTLAAGTVHEIQNPLAFTVTSLDIAARALEGPLDAAKLGELRIAMQNAREGAARVTSIARDLRTFARANDELRTDVDVALAVESAVKLIRPQIERRATLVRRIGPVPAVRANEHRLVQLLVNLIANAVESIDEGDVDRNQIVVSTTTTANGAVRIAVEDTGKGMPPLEAGRVFEPFWTSKTTGMGLGLAICHGIVSSLGGEIFHEPRAAAGSSTDQRGTRFVVLLPAAHEREASAPPPVRAAEVTRPAPGVRDRGKILVVDDEERLAATMKLALSPLHDVDVATRGDEALAKLRAGDYDVVLCDLLLPDVSGPEIFETIHETRPDLAARFVFLTGGAFGDRARTFLQRVPNPRLEKPFDLSALEALIAERLEMVRAAKR